MRLNLNTDTDNKGFEEKDRIIVQILRKAMCLMIYAIT
jgi:hypothetical protein